MEYTILGDVDIRDLIKKVNSHIGDGWKPIGGISHNGVIKLQAMTKDNHDN